jgi:hypothetical protein
MRTGRGGVGWLTNRLDKFPLGQGGRLGVDFQFATLSTYDHELVRARDSPV